MSSRKRKAQDWISSSQCCLEATPVDGTFFLLSTSVDMLKQKVGYSIIFSRGNLILSVSFRLLVHFLNSCSWYGRSYSSRNRPECKK
jgi:hypothetical protein